MTAVTVEDVRLIASGFNPDPAQSMSLRSEAYVDNKWLDAEVAAVFARTWQWVCHTEKLSQPRTPVRERAISVAQVSA